MRVMSAGSRKRIEREVGATRAEFLRALALAHSPGVETLGPDTYRVRSGDVVLDISLFEAPPRRIALIEIPVLKAVYEFVQGGGPDCEVLLAKLDRAMQRGGG